MTPTDIAQYRLYNERLAGSTFTQTTEVVAWFGAVQAQEYAHAKWALGLRLPGSDDTVMEQVFTEGRILRTHVMRPTWHFVAPADIRWLLALTGPYVNAVSASYYRKAGLDDALFARSNDVLANALEGGKQLTRVELLASLNAAGIATDGLRSNHFMMRAELDGVICSGARRGKQFTYALLEERVPPAPPLTRDEALAELVRRYFTSHGPATVQDCAWWSGLPITLLQQGLEMVKGQLIQETVDGKVYWLSSTTPAVHLDAPTVYLLPVYDEYLIAFKDRSASVAAQYAHLWEREYSVFNSSIMINGRVIGGWKRTFERKQVTLALNRFVPFSDAEEQALSAAIEKFGAFWGLPVVMES